MSGSVNKVILIGNLGADPEIRRTTAGDLIVNMRIATSESWKDKNSGERRERTEWHQVVIFNEGLAKVAEQYLKKGMKVYVEGQMQTRKWEKDGIERYTTEVVLQRFRGQLEMLSSAGGGKPPAPNGPDDYGTQSGSADRRSGGGGAASGSFDRDMDDEIPF